MSVGRTVAVDLGGVSVGIGDYLVFALYARPGNPIWNFGSVLGISVARRNARAFILLVIDRVSHRFSSLRFALSHRLPCQRSLPQKDSRTSALPAGPADEE